MTQATTNSVRAGRLRVALLTPRFWPEVRRGGERLVRDLADGLIARGHHPRIITSHPGRSRTTIEEGLPITRVWRPPSGVLRRRHWEDHLTHVPLSYACLERGRFEIAHAVFPSDALAATAWSRRTGRPSVFTYLGSPDARYLSQRRGRADLLRWATAGSSAVTALSESAAAAFRGLLGVEARVIHPGVDLERFQPCDSRADRPTIFSPAALSDPMKRGDLLLAAYERVRQAVPEARLVLDRPRDPVLAEGLSRAGEGVELVDIGADPQMLPRLYSQAWVSALPSVGEAFGLVLVESLACGTPAVGVQSGAIPEVLDSDSIGRLCPPDDEEALARALLEGLELVRDPATPGACRARAEQFSLDRCTERYEALYAELIDRRINGGA